MSYWDKFDSEAVAKGFGRFDADDTWPPFEVLEEAVVAEQKAIDAVKAKRGAPPEPKVMRMAKKPKLATHEEMGTTPFDDHNLTNEELDNAMIVDQFRKDKKARKKARKKAKKLKAEQQAAVEKQETLDDPNWMHGLNFDKETIKRRAREIRQMLLEGQSLPRFNWTEGGALQYQALIQISKEDLYRQVGGNPQRMLEYIDAQRERETKKTMIAAMQLAYDWAYREVHGRTVPDVELPF